MKAEQYIKDYTRNCSNELSNGGCESWLTPDHALRAVEITKEEAIEKAWDWIDYNNRNGGCNFDGWEDDFKNYMKGE